jgi:hypothetical protein
MFEAGMTEALNDRVQIDDIEPEVLREMLRFMYTGLVKLIDQNIKYLLFITGTKSRTDG